MCLTVVLDCAVYRGCRFVMLCGLSFVIDAVVETCACIVICGVWLDWSSVAYVTKWMYNYKIK